MTDVSVGDYVMAYYDRSLSPGNVGIVVGSLEENVAGFLAVKNTKGTTLIPLDQILKVERVYRMAT